MARERPDLTGDGVGEDRWRAAGSLDALPRVDAAGLVGGDRVVVVAPHPDDEVLGAGGLLARLARDAHDVLVVGVTDGEGSHPGSPTLRATDLAARRREERWAALAHLGLAGDAWVCLGLPDGAVVDDAVAQALGEHVRPSDVVLAPREGDGHPDHDATARGVVAATRASGGRRLGYAVWFWHHRRPEEPDALLEDGRAPVRVDLDRAARAAKAEAIAAFTTQIHPLSPDPRDAAILPPAIRARFDRPFEVFW